MRGAIHFGYGKAGTEFSQTGTEFRETGAQWRNSLGKKVRISEVKGVRHSDIRIRRCDESGDLRSDERHADKRRQPQLRAEERGEGEIDRDDAAEVPAARTARLRCGAEYPNDCSSGTCDGALQPYAALESLFAAFRM
jgi:hypothetical protein